MNESFPVWAGIGATLLMTLFSTVTWLITRRPYYIIVTLSKLLQYGRHASMDRKPSHFALIAGIAIHYGIGIGFAFIHDMLITNEFINPTLSTAIVFGIVLGIVAVAGWKLFFMITSHPLPYSLPVYLSVIFIGHIILSLGLLWAYRTLPVELPSTATIPMC